MNYLVVREMIGSIRRRRASISPGFVAMLLKAYQHQLE